MLTAARGRLGPARGRPRFVEGHAMQPDPERRALRQYLWKRGVSSAAASLAIGRSKAYLSQYLARGIPRVLSFQDSAALGALLDCDPGLLRHAEVPPRKRWKRRKPAEPPGPQTETEAACGGTRAVLAQLGPEKARWQIPVPMIRHEGHAEPDSLLILRLRGNAMEPAMREGDRLIVDTTRRVPHTGELFVLRDGERTVVKRIERMYGSAQPRLRLISTNPACAPVTCLAEDVEPIGKVIWTVRNE